MSEFGMDIEKWSCKACTYENYPKSKKCTMCLTPKPMSLKHHHEAKLIIDDDSRYQLPRIVNNDMIDVRKKSYMESKWACHKCTFLNIDKAVNCSQCLTKRIRTRTSPSKCPSPTTSFGKAKSKSYLSSSNESPDQMHHSILPSSSYHDNDKNEKTKSNSNLNLSSLETEIHHIEMHPSSSYYNNDKNRTGGKWTCPICTYDNHLKSKKCVMCRDEIFGAKF